MLKVLLLFIMIIVTTGNKACIYNHTLLLWKMGHVKKAIEGWMWYRELAITTHEQCQRELQQLNKRYMYVLI